MKPNPFAPLKNFTVPFILMLDPPVASRKASQSRAHAGPGNSVSGKGHEAGEGEVSNQKSEGGPIIGSHRRFGYGRLRRRLQAVWAEKRPWPFPRAISANCRDGHIARAYRHKGVAPTQWPQPFTAGCISLDLIGA